jgi:alkyl hydroperoxide reductase subunit AhpC
LDATTTQEETMAVRINDDAPNFTAETTEGKLDFHKWKGDSWAVLFSHPKDFTPVCTTELGAVAGLKGEFEKRGVKVIGVSVDPLESHEGWAADIKEVTGNELNFPLIADPSHEIAEKYDMLPASAGTELAQVLTVRSVYVIGPDNKIKLSLTYPASTGRNFQEILRAIDSLQLTAKHSVATPADWKQGDDVIIANSVNDDDAKAKFGDFTKVKPYLRTTKQPK